MSATMTRSGQTDRESRSSRPPRVAMVGAGQLARMTHQAAIALGVELRVLADSEADPAVTAGAAHLIGSPESLGDLQALAAEADVVTFDHEKIPPEHLSALEADGVLLAPSPAAKLFAQDKHAARRELSARGFPVPPFILAGTRDETERFGDEHGWPLIGKVVRGAYDGRGVFELSDLDAAVRALDEVGPFLLEPRLELRRELAVLVARSVTGEVAAYPAVETVQRDAMCREVLAPADVGHGLAEEARRLALDIATGIAATGIVAIELFETQAGLLVNELALRPHNSGHYTIEGCVTSQFEQHLRAVLGWPLGATDAVAPAVAMVNVVGPDDGSDPAARIEGALSVPGAHVHLYGKQSRPGRKLGHVTVCGDDLESARAAARRAAAALEGSS
jgi:5-(carboxyamino)imidazole ribonucleotide synthase